MSKINPRDWLNPQAQRLLDSLSKRPPDAPVTVADMQEMAHLLLTHVAEAAEMREKVARAAHIMNGVTKFFRGVPEIFGFEGYGLEPEPRTERGHEAVVMEKLHSDRSVQPSPGVVAIPETSSSPKGPAATSASKRGYAPVVRNVGGLVATLFAGLVVAPRVLPPSFAIAWDVGTVTGIGVFGWLGLLAAFRERHRDLRTNILRP